MSMSRGFAWFGRFHQEGTNLGEGPLERDGCTHCRPFS